MFYWWILGKKEEYEKHHIKVSTFEDENKKTIQFSFNQNIGLVKIWSHEIIEEEIIDENEEHLFYLHYHITNIKQCVHLFDEFFKVVLHYNNQIKIKVALCCSGGLSTSLFSTKLTELVALEKLNYEFDAIGFYRLGREYQQYDAILLAPQISYLEPTALNITQRSVPIFCIEPIDFATNNYHRILSQLNQLELSVIR